MLKFKQRSTNNKIYPKNKNAISKPKYKEVDEKDSIKNKLMTKTTNKSIISNQSNSSSNNSSISKNRKSKKKEKKNIQPEIKKEKKIDEELIRQQYKIIKEFLIPILKEQNAKELVSCYNKMEKVKKKLKAKDKVVSLRNKPILEYSFVTGKSKNKIKIPLFQIMTPNQFKDHVDKKNKERLTTMNKLKKNSTTSIINNMNISETKKFENNNINSINAKNEIKSTLLANNTSIRNNNIKTPIKNDNENTSIQNNNNNIIVNDNNTKVNNNQNKNIKKTIPNVKENRAKTPPLYLRINEVKQKHEEEMQKLRKKYEYNYKKINNNTKNNKTKNENESFSEFSDTSSSIISKDKSNKTQNDFEKWYNYEKTWQKMKDMKLNIIKSELEENKICQNINNKKQETFKPKINKNSENLLLKKYDGDFYIRLKDYQKNKERKTKMLKQKLKPNFKPFVNANYNINREYYLYMKYDQRKINEDLKVFLE